MATKLNKDIHWQMGVSSRKGHNDVHISFTPSDGGEYSDVYIMPVWAATDLAMLIFKNIGPVRFIKERIRLMFSRRKGK